MSWIRSWLLVLGCSAAACVVGCSESPPAAAPSEKSNADEQAAPKAPADTADQAVLAVIRGLEKKQLRALWDFLPAGYQRDVNELVHEFANRMDPQLWGRTVGVLRKLATTLRSQKKFLAPPNGAAPPAGQGLPDLLELLADSELGDLQRLKKADVGKFLDGTGGRLMDQLQVFSQLVPHDPFSRQLADLSELRVTLQSSRGDTALVLIEVPDDEPRPTEFVRVEGKWIPKALADAWIEAMGEARARLSVLTPENLASVKPQWLELLDTADSALDRLSQARTAQDFQTALAGAQFALLPLAGMLTASLPETEPQETEVTDQPPELKKSEVITLVVHGKLTEAARETLESRLVRIVPEAKEGLFESTGDDERTSFKLGPVANIEEFAAKLGFLDHVEVDTSTRTVSGQLKN